MISLISSSFLVDIIAIFFISLYNFSLSLISIFLERFSSSVIIVLTFLSKALISFLGGILSNSSAFFIIESYNASIATHTVVVASPTILFNLVDASNIISNKHLSTKQSVDIFDKILKPSLLTKVSGHLHKMVPDPYGPNELLTNSEI